MKEPVALVLLDISLPRLDGRKVLRRIRLRPSDLPILMLTARDATRNKVGALDAGADDYLTKPFVFEELLARICALTRRAGRPASAQIQTDDLRIDLLSRHAWRKDEKIELSSREFALLEYFMRHCGQGLSRQQILSAIWDYDFDPASNVVDVYVRHLRNKVDPRRSLLDLNHPRRRLPLRSSPQRLKRFAHRAVSYQPVSRQLFVLG